MSDIKENIPNLPSAISELFRNKDPEVQKKGYLAFLKRTHWMVSQDPNYLKQVACSQLGISTHKITCSHIKTIQPGLLWASQNGLEADKLNMVTDASNYFKQNQHEFPPIIVWNFFDEQKMRYVVHDGHHRTYFAYRMNQKLRAVILEPLGLYEEVKHKFRFAFNIRKRVLDLPVTRPYIKAKKLEEEKIEVTQKISTIPQKETQKINNASSNDAHVQKLINKATKNIVKLDLIQEIKQKEKLGRHKGRYDFTWKYINVNNFGVTELKDFDIIDVMKMFNRRSKPMVPELAYLAYLLRSRWGESFDIERGIKRAQMELRLPLFDGEGISWSHRNLNPGKIWSSQDSLDEDALNMNRAAIKYMVEENKPIPPIIVWLIKDSSRYNFVCHDGHHRIYIAEEMKREIPVILMEYWIDNREDPLIRRKIQYEQIDTYAINLPVEKFHGVRYTKRRERYSSK